jgi:hypothetical protein
VRGLAGVERQVTGERILIHADRVTDVQAARLWELDKPVALAAAEAR